MHDHICPHCEGKGSTDGIACPGGQITSWPCSTCGGTGRVDAARIAKIEAGRKMRAERLARYVTQRERAAELGMDEVAYSRMENGRS